MALKKSYTKTGQVYYAKQPEDWVSQLKKKIKAYFAKEKQTKRQKEIQATRLSRQSKQQLADLSEMDYQKIMKMLKGKRR